MEFVSGDLKGWIARLREKGDAQKNIWLSGGGEVARSFLELGLVDEISLGVQPVLLGGGVPLFPATFPETGLELERCEKRSNSLVRLAYRVKKSHS